MNLGKWYSAEVRIVVVAEWNREIDATAIASRNIHCAPLADTKFWTPKVQTAKPTDPTLP